MGETLDFKAKVDFKQAKKDLADFEKMLAKAGVAPAGSGKNFDLKPLTEHQKEQLKIKQAVVDLARQKAEDAKAERMAKAEQAKADKSASLALQAALRDERLARQAANAAERAEKQQALAIQKQLNAEASKKKPVQISNSQAEIDAYKKATQGSSLYTSVIQAERVERAKLNVEAAKQAIAQGTLNNGVSAAVGAMNSQTAATRTATLSKKQLAQMLTEEKLRQADATKELKNNAREMLNAKGSLEQRRAALIRLTAVYDRLSAAERNASAGVRLGNVIQGITKQVQELEMATGRGGRNVGQYAGAFTQLKEQLAGAAGAMISLYAALSTAKSIVHTNAEVSDSFTDVQRTAKLTGKEIDELINQLKGVDTRTNLEGLLDIGFIGGRLSVAKDDLVEFITEVDKLAVVLKKEFPGGAEAISEALGKVIAIYKITQKEGISLSEALKKTGSAFLEVSHTGHVTVQYLQDFALRTSGIAQVAKISMPTMLAYGAILSKAGVSAQVAGGAVNRLISNLSTKRDKYFAIAQLSDSTLTLEKFTNLINTDTKAALDLFFKGLKAGNPTQTEFGDRLKTLAFSTGAVKNSIINLAENQESLATKTEIANKAYEEGTSVAHNFELANNSLAASFDKFINRLKNAITASAGARWLAELLNGMITTKTASEQLSDSFKHNTEEFNHNQEALKPLLDRYDELTAKTTLTKEEQDDLRRVTIGIGNIMPEVITKFNSYGEALDINRRKVNDMTKAQKELLALQNKSALREADDNFSELYLRAKQYENAALIAIKKGYDPTKFKESAKLISGQAAAAARSIRDLGGSLTELQQQSIDYFDKADKKIKPQAATVVGDGMDEIETDVVRTTEVIKAEIKALQDSNIKLATTSAQFKSNIKQILRLKEELRLANGGKEKSDPGVKAAISAQRSLQSEIDDLNTKARRKQLDNDAEELAAVDDKYAKLREKAIKFNNDPINKRKGLRVDVGGLISSQSYEKDAIIDKQGAEKLKVSLDEQKKLYDEYEAYKNKVGKAAADKRYSDLIDTDRTYLERLEIQRSAITDPQKNKGGTEEDIKASEERLKVLDKEIAAEKLAQGKKQQELLAEFVSYSDARKALAEKYEADLIIIGDNSGAREKRKQAFDKDLKELDFENLKKLDSYEKLFVGIDKLSEKSALQTLRNGRKKLDEDILSGAITDPEEIAKIKAYFNEIEQTIREGSGRALQDLGAELSNVAGAVGEVNAEFGKMLGVIGSVVSRVGDIKSGLKDFNKDGASGFEKLTAGLGIVGAGISIFQSVFKLFDRSAQREEQAAYSRDLQNKQTEALNKALERQIALLDDVYGTERIAKYSEAIAQAQANEEKYQAQLAGRYKLTGDATLDKYITRLNNGEGLGGILNEADFRKQLEKIGATLPTDIASLQTLLDEGKLDAATSTIVSNLIQANKTAQELANNLRAENVGAGLSTIVDDFITDLTDGMDGVEGSLQNAIRRGLLQGLKGELTQKYIQEFYAQLDGALKDGQISAEEDAQLKALYTAAEEYGKAKLEYINSIAPESGGGSADTLKGRIESITSNQADKLEGVFRAVQVNGVRTNALLEAGNNWMAQTYQMVSGNLAELVKITANTGRTADNTTDIPAIKKALESIDKKMNNGTNAMQGNGYSTGI